MCHRGAPSLSVSTTAGHLTETTLIPVTRNLLYPWLFGYLTGYIEAAHNTDAKIDVNIVEGLTDAEYKRLTIVLNETRGQADKIELAVLLSELDKTMGNDLMTALPYDPGELDELIKLADYDWDSFESTFEHSSEGGSDGRVFKAKLSDEQHDLVTQTKALVTEQLADADDENALLLELLCREYLGL